MSKMLDSLQMIRRGELPPPPVARLIGITMASAEPRRGRGTPRLLRAPSV